MTLKESTPKDSNFNLQPRKPQCPPSTEHLSQDQSTSVERTRPKGTLRTKGQQANCLPITLSKTEPTTTGEPETLAPKTTTSYHSKHQNNNTTHQIYKTFPPTRGEQLSNGVGGGVDKTVVRQSCPNKPNNTLNTKIFRSKQHQQKQKGVPLKDGSQRTLLAKCTNNQKRRLDNRLYPILKTHRTWTTHSPYRREPLSRVGFPYLSTRSNSGIASSKKTNHSKQTKQPEVSKPRTADSSKTKKPNHARQQQKKEKYQKSNASGNNKTLENATQ
jgi:hypothetical protein